jgi:hypothetical protein
MEINNTTKNEFLNKKKLRLDELIKNIKKNPKKKIRRIKI